MKIVFSEYNTNYSTYSYGYGVYAIAESENDIGEIYDKGFLPYSGSGEIENHFYLCRSLRVNLKKFSLSSENKRIQKLNCFRYLCFTNNSV